MYRYFECKRNPAHRMAVQAHPSGAYAVPACDQCMGPTLLIGQGDAPIAPPPGAPNMGTVEALTDEKVEVLSGYGFHDRLGRVDYYLKKNEAQEDAVLTVKVGQKTSKVRFHLSLLSGSTSEDRVKAPMHGVWMTIEPNSDAMGRIGVLLSNPPKMDSTIRITLKIGTPRYGLVHVIAGHHDDLRTLTGVGIATVSVGSDTDEGKKQQRKLEQYRSFLAVQAGLQKCLARDALQAIYKIEPDKWIFVGEWKNKCFMVVTQKNGSDYDITTLYIGAVGGINAVSGVSNRKVAWKRKMAKLPSGW